MSTRRPDVVFELISRSEHMREWWPDDARSEPVAGAPGGLVRRNAETGETLPVALAVVEADPPKRFSFRWCSFLPGDRVPPRPSAASGRRHLDARLRRIKRVAEAVEHNRNNNQGE